MARIAGIELNDNWKLDFALTRIKGVGWSVSRDIMETLGFDKTKRVKDLTSEDIGRITSTLDENPTEGDLVRRVRANIQRLQAIGSYRGMRHTKGLPSRGQRTKSHFRRNRSKGVGIKKKKKEVTALKKEAMAQKPADKNRNL